MWPLWLQPPLPSPSPSSPFPSSPPLSQMSQNARLEPQQYYFYLSPVQAPSPCLTLAWVPSLFTRTCTLPPLLLLSTTVGLHPCCVSASPLLPTPLLIYHIHTTLLTFWLHWSLVKHFSFSQSHSCQVPACRVTVVVQAAALLHSSRRHVRLRSFMGMESRSGLSCRPEQNRA